MKHDSNRMSLAWWLVRCHTLTETKHKLSITLPSTVMQ